MAKNDQDNFEQNESILDNDITINDDKPYNKISDCDVMSDSEFENFLDFCNVNDRNSMSYSEFNERQKEEKSLMEPKTIVFDIEKNGYSDAVKVTPDEGIENGATQRRHRLKPVYVEKYSTSHKSLNWDDTDEEGFIKYGSRSKKQGSNEDRDISPHWFQYGSIIFQKVTQYQ